jgi:uncharacterized repeat protein (TIGR03843 family)
VKSAYEPLSGQSIEWPAQDDAELTGLLQEGDLTLEGLISWGSNYVFLGQVQAADASLPVVYKPVRGERPLADFPSGTLAAREVGAFVLDRLLGWRLVPPTVMREGEYGAGSVQLFLPVDQEAHFFTFRDDRSFRPALMSLVAFDIIANNADRKAGHCLRHGKRTIVAIDHGLCFHTAPKLRTVIWDFAGLLLPRAVLSALRRLLDDWSTASSCLAPYLTVDEIGALRARAEALLASRRFPHPPEGRRPYPWPPI